MKGVIPMAKRTLKKEEEKDIKTLSGSVDIEKDNVVIALPDKEVSVEVIGNTEIISENANPENRQADIKSPDTESKEDELCNIKKDMQEDDTAVEKKQKEEGTVFRSTSEELRCIIRDVVEDGEVYSKKVLVRILNEKASTDFTDACLINVLRNMVTDGSLMQVERGSYMKGNGSFKSRLHKYLSATRSGLKKACTLNASEMEEADFEIIKQIKAVECDLDILMKTLERLGA